MDLLRTSGYLKSQPSSNLSAKGEVGHIIRRRNRGSRVINFAVASEDSNRVFRIQQVVITCLRINHVAVDVACVSEVQKPVRTGKGKYGTPAERILRFAQRRVPVAHRLV